MVARRLCSVAALMLCAALAPAARAGISYDTGTVQGHILNSSGAPVPQTSVRATSQSGAGQSIASADATGAYTLILPVDTYLVEAVYQNAVFGSTTITVTAQQTATADFTFSGGTLQTIITRDGVPVAGASVQVHLQAPGCNAPGATCNQPPGFAGCSCTLGGQPYNCDASGNCQWMMVMPFWTYTDSNGVASLLVPTGTYDVIGYAAQEPNQYGQLALGTFVQAVADGQTVAAGEFDYTTGLVGGAVTIGGQPAVNARVRAVSTVAPGGEVDANVDGSGLFSLRLPSGSYTLTATLDGFTPLVDPVTISVAAGSSQQLSFNKPGGYLAGSVVRDGAPAAFASVRIALQAPGCNAPGATCNQPPGSTGCSCWLNGQSYNCDANGVCNWMMSSPIYTTTDANGNFAQLIAPGAYNVTVYATTEWPQYGQIAVNTLAATVVDGQTTTLPPTSYETGYVTGSVTSCGAPLSNVSLRAVATNGAGELDASADFLSGAYDARLPVGTYTLTAEWQGNTPAGSTTLTVTPGVTLVFSPTFDVGQLRGLILRDGQPAAQSQAQIVLQAPGCNAPGASCWQPPGVAGCSCSLNGQPYSCDANGVCRWMMSPSFWANTGSDGFFTASLPAGDYSVLAYASATFPQYGQILVGTVPVTVLACQLTEVGASGTTIAAGTDVPANLGDGVSLNFSSVDGGGSVSFTATSTPQGAPPPSGGISFVGLFYDFTIGASFSGNVQVCLPYDVEEVPSGTALRLYHFTGGVWVDVTTSVDTVNHLVCGDTSSFSYFVVGEQSDHAPVANAGAPIHANVDASCSALVHLDGSASTDADGADDIASYIWSLGGNVLGSGVTLDVALGPGSYTAQLVVTDREGQSSSASVAITVLDTSPPTIALSVSPSVIWPANGQMVTVTPSFTVVDNCDKAPQTALTSISADDGAPVSDMQIDPDHLHAEVRAARFGTDLAGRTYRLRYRAADASGNAAYSTATVLVPHDQGK